MTIGYVGFAHEWDEVNVMGSISDRDCLVAYRKNGKPLAVASVNRDAESLRVQVAMERGDVGCSGSLSSGTVRGCPTTNATQDHDGSAAETVSRY